MLFSDSTYDENVFINCAESVHSDIPGAEYINGRYHAFKRDLPQIASLARLNPANLTYVDYCFVISEWLKANARS